MSIFNKLFNNYDAQEIGGLTDELKCIYINNCYQNNYILVVCNSLYEANKFYQTLKNYNDDVYFFPMDDFMTSEVLAISPDFKMTRLETLDSIVKNKKGIVVTNLMGYLRFLPTKNNFINSYIRLKVGDNFDIKSLTQKFYNIGYERDITVNKTGEMAIRGYVLDIFPINYNNPIRIEFWGDEIESIRFFDINTQLTINTVQQVEIVPNSEFLIDKDIDFEYNHRDLIKYGSSNIYEYMNGHSDYRELFSVKAVGYEGFCYFNEKVQKDRAVVKPRFRITRLEDSDVTDVQFSYYLETVEGPEGFLGKKTYFASVNVPQGVNEVEFTADIGELSIPQPGTYNLDLFLGLVANGYDLEYKRK